MKARVEARVANLNEPKPFINYPTFLEYKVVFEKQDAVNAIFRKILGEKREFSHELSKDSKNSKYQSYTLKVFVLNEKDKNRIFNALKERAKFVL